MKRVAPAILVTVVLTHGVVSQGDEQVPPSRIDGSAPVSKATPPILGSSRHSSGALQPGTASIRQGQSAETSRTAVNQPSTPPIPAPKSANRNWTSTNTKSGANQPQTGSHRPPPDGQVQRTQISGLDIQQPPLPGAALMTSPPALPTAAIGGQSISLQAALYGALTSNPDLVTLRQGNVLAISAEAVEVARHFPTTLNPTLWIDYRPITLVPTGTFGSGTPGGGHTGLPGANGFYHYGQNYIYVSLRQPIELGHQTTHRYRIAQALYDQQKWIVVQAELTALVQTYRFFQTAAYRREKFQLARELAKFNDQLLETLQRRLGTNATLAADVSLARVESRASRQQIKAAQQDYLTALADLRNQVGISEQAGAIEPLGEFMLPPYIPPLDEQAMINEALQNRPDIHAANAQIASTHSAVDLAKADRIPTIVSGPQYEMDEAGVQYIGFVLIAPIPIWNNGKPLVLQREAEHRRAVVAFEQAQQRTVAQVRAAVAKWNSARELLSDSTGLSSDLKKEVDVLDRLFEGGQTDLTKLMQARQRLIQLENSRLDAVWAATQAQADLLLALGVPALINDMLNRAETASIPTAADSRANPPKGNTAATVQPALNTAARVTAGR
jgi:outer membrane protein, heavy metal efflux system